MSDVVVYDGIVLHDNEEHPKLRAFLGEIELEKHVAAMVQAGYDDVDDFKNFDADSFHRIRYAGSADKAGGARWPRGQNRASREQQVDCNGSTAKSSAKG